MQSRAETARARGLALVVLAGALACACPRPAWGQGTGSVAGLVTVANQDIAAVGVTVLIDGTTQSTTTQLSGRYELRDVTAGRHVIVFRGLGYEVVRREIVVAADQRLVVDVTLARTPVRLGELMVEGASRVPERVVEAPAAIAVVDRGAAADYSITGQAPRVLAGLPGVDVVQSGINDFNVNARGFNSSLNRRMLVLQDGRDLAVPLLGFQEWSGLSTPLAELWTIEVVRGPGSALYGANAYNGVINIRTPPARDVVGTKLSLAGGELRSMHGTVRWAGVSRGGRLGYKLSAGHNRSDSWTRARTSADRGDLRREYGGLTDEAGDVMESVPLFGQRLDPVTRAAVGRPDVEATTHGSARIDLYGGAAVATIEGGATLARNATLVTGIGRIQTDRVLRPWARAAWNREDLSFSVWYSGRSTGDRPHRSLGSGAPITDHSATVQAEAQANRRIADDRGRVVLGASVRNTRTDTDTTLFPPADDERSDYAGAVYAQVEYELLDELSLVGALRYDEGSIFDAQLSPRLALVYSPVEDQSLRFTVHRAFQTPTQLEHFLRTPAARPADFSALEAGLRASPLGAALADVPSGTLFTVSTAVPVLGLGNADLDVETVHSFELGYRGQLGRIYLSVEGYYARLADFVTDLLPAANPKYGAWTAPAEVPAEARATLEQAVRSQLAAAGQSLAALGLTRLDDGRTAIVVSYGNAGRAEERGIEVGATISVAPGIQLDASHTWFDFTVERETLLAGDVLVANTPRHKGTLSASYRQQRFDVGLTAHFVDAFRWASGAFAGPVPSRQTLDVRAGLHIRRNIRLQVMGTNVLDQRRYQMFGGSLIGRRVMAGLTAAF